VPQQKSKKCKNVRKSAKKREKSAKIGEKVKKCRGGCGTSAGPD